MDGSEAVLRQQNESFKEFAKDLLREQSDKFDVVANDLSTNAQRVMQETMQTAVQESIASIVKESIERSPESYASDLKAHLTSQVALAMDKPEPRTLRQAMAAAEEDLKRHLFRVDKYYHKINAQGLSSGVANNTADFIIALRDAIKYAQAAQNV